MLDSKIFKDSKLVYAELYKISVIDNKKVTITEIMNSSSLDKKVVGNIIMYMRDLELINYDYEQIEGAWKKYIYIPKKMLDVAKKTYNEYAEIIKKNQNIHDYSNSELSN